MATNHGNSICGLRDCVPILKGIALVTTSLYAGSSLYISMCEHPSRMLLPNEFALKQWKNSIQGAKKLQCGLVALASASSLLTFGSIANAICHATATTSNAISDSVRHCCHCKGTTWLASGLLMASIVPISKLCMEPICKQLNSNTIDTFDDSTRQLLNKWGKCNWVKTLISLGAVSLLYCKLFRHSHIFLTTK
ncbi:hypothetical protein DICPUDRAFT_95243 [Dictyostelium purpureum]|uniref:DUF4149 domain-containing protein n=1 Tax=Dictyostelium purpureum TaxID=5786 RepID=F0ZTZ4_DICPU|nr:uncharacterized protein DICPUDRAFT_95243 [Dictyostelium purpureum]EGC32602.1 hypothetical protein DICPUDRAFT_95243 [Dictyostelium purpureum]|eukprot:XP_003290893.1 hypothetical protein DICPUDRAFT_95243 [Dictyostelium purpureum]